MMAQGWVEPVDFAIDNIGDDTPKHTVSGFDRCDTLASVYAGEDSPSICHRWGLVWSMAAGSVERITDWKPNRVADGDYRLPTIKELVRLFDYTYVAGSFVGFDSSTILGAYINTEVTGDQSKAWIVSSSYRDIDGQYDSTSDRLQILAINVTTGEVQAFEPGNKAGGSERLDLCTELWSNGDCSLDDSQTLYQIRVRKTKL